MPITHERIDPDALKVVRRLQQFRYQAYVVGGSVRDLLLGGTPKDFDVATNATPNEIRHLFRNARIIGRRFRLAHLLFGRKVIETSTFRRHPRDGELENGDSAAEPGANGTDETTDEDLLIRQDNVFGTAEEDARRRDFTVNSLFYDPLDNRIIDYVDGMADLENGVIRTIGDPDIRLREDPVRILRAIRFAARLGFEIEPATMAAIVQHRLEIARCSPPRLLEDLYRLLRRGGATPSLSLMRDTEVLTVLMPELASAIAEPSVFTAYERSLSTLDEMTRKALVPTNSLLLATVLLPLVESFANPSCPLPSQGDPVMAVDMAVRPILNRLKVPRREVDRFRKVVLAQRRLLGNRTRRFKPMAFARREEFPEALAFLEIMLGWRGGTDEASLLEQWHQIARGAHVALDLSQSAQSFARPRRRRFRVRGSLGNVSGHIG